MNGQHALIFVDNFSTDIEWIEFLLKNKNIQFIGFEREYNYQIISHRIKEFDFETWNISDLSDEDLQGLSDSIPLKLQKNGHIRKEGKSSISLFEFISKNVNRASVRERYRELIIDLENKESNLLDLFIMICYVHTCRTPVSYDMIYSFLREEISSWQDVYEKINALGELIKEYGDGMELVSEEQDYYKARSGYIATSIVIFIG